VFEVIVPPQELTSYFLLTGELEVLVMAVAPRKGVFQESGTNPGLPVVIALHQNAVWPNQHVIMKLLLPLS
jgi:hypothetical protein